MSIFFIDALPYSYMNIVLNEIHNKQNPLNVDLFSKAPQMQVEL